MDTIEYCYDISYKIDAIEIQKRSNITLYIIAGILFLLVVILKLYNDHFWWIYLLVVIIVVPLFLLLHTWTPNRGIISSGKIEIHFPKLFTGVRNMLLTSVDIKEIHLSHPMCRSRYWVKYYHPQFEIIPQHGRTILFTLGSTRSLITADQLIDQLHNEILNRFTNPVVINKS